MSAVLLRIEGTIPEVCGLIEVLQRTAPAAAHPDPAPNEGMDRLEALADYISGIIADLRSGGFSSSERDGLVEAIAEEVAAAKRFVADLHGDAS